MQPASHRFSQNKPQICYNYPTMGLEQDRSARNREIAAYEGIAVGFFKEKYNLFKRLRPDNIILFITDFLPWAQEYSYNLYSALEVALPEDRSGILIGAKYSNLRNAFLKVFEKDRLSDDYNIGLSKSIPFIETQGLRRFLNNNSTTAVDTRYQVYDLIGEGKRRITVTRFCNPFTMEPISEVWTATSINRGNPQTSVDYDRIRARLPISITTIKNVTGSS